MNSTSFFSRLVSSAARSLGFSSTGPLVWRRFTPSSAAMMWDSVVLPRPGGPNSSTWSSASRASCRADEDLQLLARLGLAHVVVQQLGAQRALQRLFGEAGGGHEALRGAEIVGLDAHARAFRTAP
jgi:hypothetical protein